MANYLRKAAQPRTSSLVRRGTQKASRTRAKGDTQFAALVRRLENEGGSAHYAPAIRDTEIEPRTASEVARRCLWFVDATAAYLTARLKQKVSISVKFLWQLESDREPVLRTLCRSTNTKETREAYAPQNNIHYMENTAFRSIMHDWPTVTHFASDNLLDRWIAGEYENSNRKWMSFYNSTAVVPVPQSKTGKTLPVGFFCADSLTGKLSQEWIIQMLGEASSHLYDILGILFLNATELVRVPNIDEPNHLIHLPCGWKFDGERLVAQDVQDQLRFQSVLESLEQVYAAELYVPSTDSAEESTPITEENEVPRKQYEQLLRSAYVSVDGKLDDGKAFVEPPAPEEVDMILERMAMYNPDAARLLRDRRGSM